VKIIHLKWDRKNGHYLHRT